MTRNCLVSYIVQTSTLISVALSSLYLFLSPSAPKVWCFGCILEYITKHYLQLCSTLRCSSAPPAWQRVFNYLCFLGKFIRCLFNKIDTTEKLTFLIHFSILDVVCSCLHFVLSSTRFHALRFCDIENSSSFVYFLSRDNSIISTYTIFLTNRFYAPWQSYRSRMFRLQVRILGKSYFLLDKNT